VTVSECILTPLVVPDPTQALVVYKEAKTFGQVTKSEESGFFQYSFEP